VALCGGSGGAHEDLSGADGERNQGNGSPSGAVGREGRLGFEQGAAKSPMMVEDGWPLDSDGWWLGSTALGKHDKANLAFPSTGAPEHDKMSWGAAHGVTRSSGWGRKPVAVGHGRHRATGCARQ
jgi:hypothetical protein